MIAFFPLLYIFILSIYILSQKKKTNYNNSTAAPMICLVTFKHESLTVPSWCNDLQLFLLQDLDFHKGLDNMY